MLSKFKHKTPHEIVYRLQKMVKARMRERAFDPQKTADMLAKMDVGITLQDMLENKQGPVFYFNRDRQAARDAFRKYFPEEIRHSVARADKILENKFTMLGHDFSFPEGINWHVDPITGREYSRDYYKRVDIFSDDGKTDIKHVWEVNRHQYFIDLAKAYFITGDGKYAAKVVALFDDWVEQNPYQTGVSWASALEVAVRSYAWIWTLYFLLDSDLVDDAFVSRFMKQMYLAGDFLSEHLSYYFSPYNHLIGEASALFMIGYTFPWLKNAASWASTGWKVLTSEIDKQFHPDGFTVEQASFYHYFTLGFYLQPVIIRLQNNDSVPDSMLRHLESIFNFSLHLTRPDGSTPWVGDIDNARSIYFTDPESWEFRNFLALGAVMFESPALKHSAEKNWEDVLWLFGEEGFDRYTALNGHAPQEKARHFVDSGYAIGRSDWTSEAHYYRFDCGEIADGVFRDEVRSAAHGHADILGFELSAFGKNFIVDPGFHNYRGKVEWHQYFRNTPAHNCLVIDGKSHAKHGGILEWSHRSDPKVLKVVNKDHLLFFRGTHDAFRDLPGSPQHVRNFLFINDDFWVIVDEVTGSGEHTIDSYLHFGDVDVGGGGNHLIASDGQVKLHTLLAGNSNPVALSKGGNGPRDGWLAPLYRQSIPAPVAHIQAKQTLPYVQQMIFIPQEDKNFELSRHGQQGTIFRTARAQYALQLGAEFALSGNEPLLIVEWQEERIVLNRLSDSGQLQYFKLNGKQDANLIWEEPFDVR